MISNFNLAISFTFLSVFLVTTIIGVQYFPIFILIILEKEILVESLS